MLTNSPLTVHLEPKEFFAWEAEDCVVCRKPTRYWLTPHIPLCPGCAYQGSSTLGGLSLTPRASTSSEAT